MEQLLPFELYQRAGDAQYSSIRIRGGILFGLGMGLFTWFIQRDGLVEALLTGAISGLLFGFGWTFLMRRAMKGLVRRIYDGDPAITAPPPSDTEYQYSFPASLLHTPAMAIGGVLYVGSRDWLFVPHKRNLSIHREPRRIGPGSGLQLSLQQRKLSVPTRLLISHAAPLIRVQSTGDTWLLIVPVPEATLTRLQEVAAV